MLRNAFQTLGLFLIVGVSCRADLTLRYTVDIKVGGAMPPALLDAMKQQAAATLPKEKVIRIKGDKTLSGIGAITGIIDNASQDITLLNPATKQFARVPLAGYVTAVQAGVSPAVQQAMERMKLDVQSTSTGQMAMVFGIRAEEHLTTMTISMDLPDAAAAAGAQTRLEIRTWLASPSDLDRIPGLRQYADHAQRALTVFNSADEIQKLFSRMPGVGEKMRAATAELTKNAGSLTVKMQENIYMPMMGQLLARTQSDPPKTDPNTPLMELHMDLAAISTDAIDDSVFDVPSDYRMAPASELIKALTPAPVQLPKADGTAAPVPPVVRRPDLDPAEQISRVGGGVGAPSVIYKRDPLYTEEARKAKLSGSVMLSVVVDTDGNARNIRVVKSLGLGLDEKAIDAVSQWRFRPGQKDGQPVNVRATIEINFRLLVDPPLQ